MAKRISNHNKSNCSVCNPQGGKKNLSGKSDLIVENSTTEFYSSRLDTEKLELPNKKSDIVNDIIVKEVLAESKELSERQTLLKKAKLCVEAFKYTYPDASNEEIETGAIKLMEMPGHFLEKLVEQNKKREKDLSQAHTPTYAKETYTKESIDRQTKELNKDIITLKEALLKEVKDSNITDLIELENKRYHDEWKRYINQPFQPKESNQIEKSQPKVIAVPATAVTPPVVSIPSNITWDPNNPQFYTTTSPNFGIPFFYKIGDTSNVGNVPSPSPNFIINSEPIHFKERIMPNTTITTVAADSTDKSLPAPKVGDPINLNTFGSILGNLYQAFSIPFQNFINDGYIR